MNSSRPILFVSTFFLVLLLESCKGSTQTFNLVIPDTTQTANRFGKNRLLILSSERDVNYDPKSSFSTVISITDPEMLNRKIAYISDDTWWNTTMIASSAGFGEKILIAKKRINDLWLSGGSLNFLDNSLKVEGRNPMEISGIYFYQAYFLSGGSSFVYLAYDSKNNKTRIMYSFDVDNLTVDESSQITETSGFAIPSESFDGYYYFNADDKVFRESKRISPPEEDVSYLLPSTYPDRVYYVANKQIKWISLADNISYFLMNDPESVDGVRTFVRMSPDATKIAYSPIDNLGVLHIASMGGGDIATRKIEGSVFWSPDSTLLLIESKPPVVWNINTDQTTVLDIPEWVKFGTSDSYYGDMGFPIDYPWSPDGKFLLFRYPYDYLKVLTL